MSDTKNSINTRYTGNSMTPEQERAEREGFYKWFNRPADQILKPEDFVRWLRGENEGFIREAWLAACAHKEAQYVTKIATFEKRIELLRDGLREIWGTGDRDRLDRFIENLQDEDDRLAGGE